MYKSFGVGLVWLCALSGCGKNDCEDGAARVEAVEARCGGAPDLAGLSISIDASASGECNDLAGALSQALAACYEEAQCADGTYSAADLSAINRCLSGGE